jgi:hypothetical protein
MQRPAIPDRVIPDEQKNDKVRKKNSIADRDSFVPVDTH